MGCVIITTCVTVLNSQTESHSEHRVAAKGQSMSPCEDPKGHTHGTELRTMEEELGVLTFHKHTPCARHLSDSITLNLALITQSIKHCPQSSERAGHRAKSTQLASSQKTHPTLFCFSEQQGGEQAPVRRGHGTSELFGMVLESASSLQSSCPCFRLSLQHLRWTVVCSRAPAWPHFGDWLRKALHTIPVYFLCWNGVLTTGNFTWSDLGQLPPT